MAILSSNISLKMFQRPALLLLITGITCHTLQGQDARVVTRIVTDTVPAWKTWKAGAGSMNYPGTWGMDTVASGDTAVIFRQLATGPAAPPATVSLVVQELKGRSVPSRKKGQDIPGKDIQVISSTGPDGTGAYSIEYTGRVNGVLQHGLKRVQVHGDRSYALTYTAVEQAYGEHLFLAEAIMNSFSPPAGH